MNKLYPDAAAALDGLLRDGLLIACGGFGLCGDSRTPARCAVRDSGVQGPDLRQQQRRDRQRRHRQAAAHPAGEKDDRQLRRREQGVRAPVPRGRAGSRILPAGHAGRADARGRRRHSRLLHEDRRRHAGGRGQGRPRCSTGRNISSNAGIFADLSLVKAWKADETGNVVFRKTARNFNVPAATCGKVCVVEVEEIVPTGSLDPDCIHLPGVYVSA
jgi:3-oxoacid CoA-transferase subunit A